MTNSFSRARAATSWGAEALMSGRPGYGSRRIETEDDVRDVIAMMRLNYDRAITRE